MRRQKKPGKTIRRDDLKRYKYVYGSFTAIMYGYHVAQKTPKTSKFDFTIIVTDLRDSYGLIGDGHLWIKSRELFGYFLKNRMVSFTAKASVYRKYDGTISYDLKEIDNIKIVSGLVL